LTGSDWLKSSEMGKGEMSFRSPDLSFVLLKSGSNFEDKLVGGRTQTAVYDKFAPRQLILELVVIQW
jgi:hypothetical protein